MPIQNYNHPYWWFNLANPDSFEYYNLDLLYDVDYFKRDHLDESVSDNIASLMDHFYRAITANEKKLETVIEFGSAAGWCTEVFLKKGYAVQGIEGSLAGYNRCVERGLKDFVIRHDLRTPLNLDKRYDMAICTEVAEHIEIPFSSVLVTSLVRHSDIVWFSFNSVDGHTHHSNCQPAKFWINLFDVYGYGFLQPNPKWKRDLQDRLDLIFYNKRRFINLPHDLIINF